MTPEEFLANLIELNRRSWHAYKQCNVIQIYRFPLSLVTERDRMSDAEVRKQRDLVTNVGCADPTLTAADFLSGNPR